MSKTITHKGKSYEIGRRYLFIDDDGCWLGLTLKSINNDISDERQFKAIEGGGYKHIKEIPQSEIGTIKVAPVELVDGESYKFNCDGDGKKDLIGIYEEESHALYCMHHVILASHCTNIRKMVVAGET